MAINTGLNLTKREQVRLSLHEVQKLPLSSQLCAYDFLAWLPSHMNT